MSEDRAITVEHLLAPISGDNPCGRGLRTAVGPDPELRELLDQTKVAKTKERVASDTGGDPAFAAISEWQSVKDHAQRVLAETSKDLPAGALLLEALVRTDGIDGVACGLELIAEIFERYWSDLFEMVRANFEDDEAETIEKLTKPIDALGGPLADRIGLVPLTSGGDAGEYALWQYEHARKCETLSESEREKQKAITVDQFIRSVNATAKGHRDWFPQLVARIAEAKKHANRIEEAYEKYLDGKVEKTQLPSLGRVKNRLDEIQQCLEFTAKDHLQAAPAPAATNGNSPAEAGVIAAQGKNGSSAELNDREDAFRELNRIADFFARTEPLSLLAEQIRQVVHRGRLSPERYFAELIDNPDSLKHFFRLVGVKAPSSEDSDSD